MMAKVDGASVQGSATAGGEGGSAPAPAGAAGSADPAPAAAAASAGAAEGDIFGDVVWDLNEGETPLQKLQSMTTAAKEANYEAKRALMDDSVTNVTAQLQQMCDFKEATKKAAAAATKAAKTANALALSASMMSAHILGSGEATENGTSKSTLVTFAAHNVDNLDEGALNELLSVVGPSSDYVGLSEVKGAARNKFIAAGSTPVEELDAVQNMTDNGKVGRYMWGKEKEAHKYIGLRFGKGVRYESHDDGLNVELGRFVSGLFKHSGIAIQVYVVHNYKPNTSNDKWSNHREEQWGHFCWESCTEANVVVFMGDFNMQLAEQEAYFRGYFPPGNPLKWTSARKEGDPNTAASGLLDNIWAAPMPIEKKLVELEWVHADSHDICRLTTGHDLVFGTLKITELSEQ